MFPRVCRSVGVTCLVILAVIWANGCGRAPGMSHDEDAGADGNVEAVCGDGVSQDGEACDDANEQPADGCFECRITAFEVEPQTPLGEYSPILLGKAQDDTLVVLWSNKGWTYDDELYARHYEHDGISLGDRIQVNDRAGGIGERALAVLPGGGFAAVWRQGLNSTADFCWPCVWGRLFDGSGIPTCPQTLLFDTDGYAFEQMTMAPWSTDGIVAVGRLRETRPATAGPDIRGLYGVRFDNSGTLDASLIPLVEAGEIEPHWPILVWEETGDYVLFWRAQPWDESFGTLMGMRMDSGLSPVGQPFLVVDSVLGTWDQNFDVAQDEDGNFVVVWNRIDSNGTSFGVYGRRLARDGTPTSGEFSIVSGVDLRILGPRVSISNSGMMAVVWWGWNGETSPQGWRDDIFGRIYELGAESGEPLATTLPFSVNVDVDGAWKHQYADVVAYSSGFFVAWSHELALGGPRRVLAQRIDFAGNQLGLTPWPAP